MDASKVLGLWKIISAQYTLTISGSGRFYQLPPGALDRAHELDSMRKKGKILALVHGIPILVKVLKSIRQSNHLIIYPGHYRDTDRLRHGNHQWCCSFDRLRVS